MPTTACIDAPSEPRVYVNQPLPETFGLPSDAVVVANLPGGDPGFRYFAPTLAELEHTVASESTWLTTAEHAGVAFAGPGISRVPVELLRRDLDGRMPGPLNLALAAAFAAHGAWVLHGAAIVGPAGGILILGNSFAGKSTTAASALLAGYRVIGDDVILLWPKEDQLVCRTLRSYATLRSESWRALSALPSFPSEKWRSSGQRFSLALNDADPALIAARCNITLRLHLSESQINQRPRCSQFSSIDPARGLWFMMQASSPALFIGGLGQPAKMLVSTAAQLLRSTPGYLVALGDRLLKEPASEWMAIYSFLE